MAEARRWSEAQERAGVIDGPVVRSDPILVARVSRRGAKVCQRGDQWLARAIFHNEKESHPDKI